MNEPARILVIEDEGEQSSTWLAWLIDSYDAVAVHKGQIASLKIADGNWDIVILSLDLPDPYPRKLLRELASNPNLTAVIATTSKPSLSQCLRVMKLGARDYLVKPLSMDILRQALQEAIQGRQLITPVPLPDRSRGDRYGDIIGRSPVMQRVFELITTVADTTATVLITGETGTGKELVARAIHSNSSRRYCPFVAVSCGAIPETLLESELFGYEKGAFTGADKTRKGRFELAHRGTLFLDEIGELSLDTQVKLLRAIQEKAFCRLGGIESIRSDFRLITATNRNIAHATGTGAFRSDLYYRLNVINIQLPPLRDRTADIPELVQLFLRKFNSEFGRSFSGIEKNALTKLMDYSWPGNVRELENVIERAVVIGTGPEIRAEHLPFSSINAACVLEPGTLEQVEVLHIRRMLDLNDWNISRTARALGIDRTTLHKKIVRYGITRNGV